MAQQIHPELEQKESSLYPGRKYANQLSIQQQKHIFSLNDVCTLDQVCMAFLNLVRWMVEEFLVLSLPHVHHL